MESHILHEPGESLWAASMGVGNRSISSGPGM